MANPEAVSPAQASLRLERTFAAPREKVFRAWTDPKAFVRWFSPSDQHDTRIPELDAKPGGRYRIEVKSPEGQLYRGAGTYREVRAPERLVFTWKWEHEPLESETLVTVEFLESGSGTRLILTHGSFTTVTSRQEHEHGWTAVLDNLQKFLG